MQVCMDERQAHRFLAWTGQHYGQEAAKRRFDKVRPSSQMATHTSACPIMRRSPARYSRSHGGNEHRPRAQRDKRSRRNFLLR